MALCDKCGNFDDEHTDGEPAIRALPDYQPTSIIIGTIH